MKIASLPCFGRAPCRLPLLLILSLTLCGALGETVYTPGKSFFGQGNYVEYIAGDMPLVISVPHGGTLRPHEIPDRKQGEFTSDVYTEELARAVQQKFHDRFGRYPHVIICRLDRRKVDCNRDIAEGAGEHPAARQAWSDYQRFVELARSNVVATTGLGFYIDLHGQNHDIRRVELGYCLSASQLTNANCALNEPPFADMSALRSLVRRTGVPFSELLRGTNSLGGLMAAKGYPAIPSPSMPSTGPGEAYFDGGYNARRHSSIQGGAIDGVQMEVNYVGVRDTASNRSKFALALAEVFDAYFTRYYGFDLRTGAAFSSR